MVLNERQTGIEAYVNEHVHASVRELAAHFFVSEMTIRRDLREMEKAGYLRRYNGGATRHSESSQLPFDVRKLLHAENKARIEQAVRPYLSDGITVFVDSSSTCLYIVPILGEYREINMITNSLTACLTAAEYHIPCTVAGGNIYERDLCTVGSETVDFLKKLNPDIAFFSLQAISDDGRITDSNPEQTAVRRTVLNNSSHSVILLDKSKYHKTCTYTFCHSSEVDEVICL